MTHTKGGDARDPRQTRPGEVAVTNADRLRACLPAHRRKVERALSLVEQAAEYGRVGVSFSGGKDSTVVLDLVRRVIPDAPAAFFDSGAELADTYAIVVAYGVTVIQPAMSLVEMCKYGGYWGHSHPVDSTATFDFGRVLIDEPAARFARDAGLAVQAIGLRADESARRRVNARIKGALYPVQRKDGPLWHLCPLQGWSVSDIWAYIADRDLAYNAAYDKMIALGITREEQRIAPVLGSDAASFGRYALLKRLDPALWNRLAADFPRIRIYT